MKQLFYAISTFFLLMLVIGCPNPESVDPIETQAQTADEFGAGCTSCVSYVRSRITLPSKDLTNYSVKQGICNVSTPQAGYAVIMPSASYPAYGHIAYVSKVVDSKTLIIDEANWGKPCGITTGVTMKISTRNVYGYYKP